MNIVITGQTGMKMMDVIENLVVQLRLRCGYEVIGANAASKDFARCYKVQDEISSSRHRFLKWLMSPDEKGQLERWERSFAKLQSKINDENPNNVFLIMHNVFFRRNRFFSPLNWDLIEKFKPDLFITSVDDVYNIWWRLRKREQEFPPSGRLRMREVMAWRSVEIMMADTLARNLMPDGERPHYVVAVKHPVDIAQRTFSPVKSGLFNPRFSGHFNPLLTIVLFFL